jgi:hypothetical protein
MRTFKARIGIVATACVLLSPTLSASATTMKHGAFAGTATLGAPLAYPCADPPGSTDCLAATTATGTGPFGEPVVTVATTAPPVSFRFGSTACIQGSAAVLESAGSKRDGASSCTISISGSLWGYCGLATGAGVLTYSNLGLLPGSNPTVGFGVTITDIAGVWRIWGADGESKFSAVAVAVPTSGTCATGSATGFTLAGEFTSTDLL